MLKLKLQYFRHLMQIADSLEKILMLGKIEGERNRGWQSPRWLDGMTDSMDLNLSKLWVMVKEREAWHTAVHGVTKSQTRLRDWTTTKLYKLFRSSSGEPGVVHIHMFSHSLFVDITELCVLQFLKDYIFLHLDGCCLVAKSGLTLFATPWTVAHRILCTWDFPGKNTGLSCHFLLQGIFPTQGSSHISWIARRILYNSATWEAPV